MPYALDTESVLIDGASSKCKCSYLQACVDLDAWQNAGILQDLDKGDAISTALVECLVKHDAARYVLPQPRC